MKKSIEMLCACLMVLVLLVACSPRCAVSSWVYITPTVENRSSGGGLKAIVPVGHEKTLDAYATTEARGPTETVEPTTEPTLVPTATFRWDTLLGRDLARLESELGLIPEIIPCRDAFMHEAGFRGNSPNLLPIVHMGTFQCFAGKFLKGEPFSKEHLYWMLLATPLDVQTAEGSKYVITDLPTFYLYEGILGPDCSEDMTDQVTACMHTFMYQFAFDPDTYSINGPEVKDTAFRLKLWSVMPLSEEDFNYLVSNPIGLGEIYPGILYVYK